MRFISLLALFACLSFPVQAQYTTNSKSTAPAAKAQSAAASRSTAQARPTQAAQQSRPAAARVRPQAAVAADEGDSDMPSFEAFAKPAAASAPAAATQGSAAPAQRVNPYAVRRMQQNAPAAQGSAQGAAQGSHQIVWPKGEIWIYMSDFSWGDIDGAFVHCEWKAVLQNRTDTTIDSLKISFVVRESYSELVFKNIKPRGANVEGMMVYSNLCPAMQGVKPKVKVLSCRMGDISGSDCSKYVVIK